MWNCWGMSRISGLRNDMNKRTFYKERRINKRFHFLSKQSIKAPLILDMYGIALFLRPINTISEPNLCWNFLVPRHIPRGSYGLNSVRFRANFGIIFQMNTNHLVLEKKVLFSLFKKASKRFRVFIRVNWEKMYVLKHAENLIWIKTHDTKKKLNKNKKIQFLML